MFPSRKKGFFGVASVLQSLKSEKLGFLILLGLFSCSFVAAEVCPRCGTFEDSQLSSCCAPGGTWFQQCGKKNGQDLAHTWTEGVQACSQTTQETAPVCPECGINAGNNQRNCCAVGGTWAGKCGADGEHTWNEGYQACNGASNSPPPSPQDDGCSVCGTIASSGERSCCATGGSWFQQCGKDKAHTWTEGADACKLQLAPDEPVGRLHSSNTVFLVIYGLKDDGLTLREVGVYDRDGEYITPEHAYMSSAFPGWDASHCYDLDSDTFCTTRLGDQDPWLELEYHMDHGLARIEIENYNKGNEGCRIVIYRDHFWNEMLWESTFQGALDKHTWDVTTVCQFNEYVQDMQCAPCPLKYTCDGVRKTMCASNRYIADNTCRFCPEFFTCDGQNRIRCQANRYIDDNKCKTCLSGYTCDGQNARRCETANYIKNNRCLRCPGGHTCNGTNATKCEVVKFVRNNQCLPCLYGHICDGTHATPCFRTQFVENNECKDCPDGHTCDGNSKVPCSNRRYIEDNQCLACPGGYVCINWQTTKCEITEYIEDNQCKPCTRGYTCNGIERSKCPITKYVDNNQCLTCPPKHTCDGEKKFECPNNKYVRENSCLACPVAHSCDGSEKYRCKDNEFVDNNVCTKCPEGFTCNGHDRIKCDEIRYIDENKCLRCPAAHYCDGHFKFECTVTQYVENNRCVDCPIDHTCDGDQKYPCDSTRYIEDNLCLPCPYGFTCDGIKKYECDKTKFIENNKCEFCPLGYTCNGMVKEKCVETNYVIDNKCETCPLAHFCDGVFATPCATNQYVENNKCVDCPDGYTCDKHYKYKCRDTGYVKKDPNPSIQSTCDDCPVGCICDGTNKDCETCKHAIVKNNKCESCPSGCTCTDGKETKCQLPNYVKYTVIAQGRAACQACKEGDETPECLGCERECVTCPNGFTCPTNGPFGQPVQCPLPRYVDKMMNECLPCPLGYTCSIENPPEQCLEDRYVKDNQCLVCPSDHTCNGVVALKCLQGKYIKDNECIPCPEGATCPRPASAPVKCNSPNYIEKNECLPCPEGHTCPNPNALPRKCESTRFVVNNKCEVCPTRHTCNGIFATQCARMMYIHNNVCKPCPMGYECDGTTEIIQCDNNQYVFNNKCTPCTDGYTCDGHSRKQCQSQRYIMNNVCKNCPYGHSCDGKIATQCANGNGRYEYVNNNRCEACPGGFTCDGHNAIKCATTKYIVANKCITCPEAHRCNGADKFRCINNQFVSGNQCQSCPLGSVCDGARAIQCASNQYIESNVCTNCPRGHTCDGQAKTVCIKQNYIEMNKCNPCPPGHTCDGHDKTQCASDRFVIDNQCQECPPACICDGVSPNCASCRFGLIISNVCESCPAGHICRDGEANLCDAPNYLRYQAGEARTKCLDCAKRGDKTSRRCKSCPGYLECVPCPEGFTCPIGPVEQPRQIVCNTNQYLSKSQCLTCPNRHRCDGTNKYECLSNQYSQNNQCLACSTSKYISENTCLDCPPRHRCDGVSKFECTRTQYSVQSQCRNCNVPKYIQGNQCEPCPSGYTCPQPDVMPQFCNPPFVVISNQCVQNPTPVCNANEYIEGQQCKSCPVRHRCDGTNKYECLPTQYSRNNQCRNCLTPKYLGGNNGNNCQPCPSGYTCPEPDTTPVRCQPPGVVQNNACLRFTDKVCPRQTQYVEEVSKQCTNCPLRHRCDGKKKYACKSTQYVEQNQCINCNTPRYIEGNQCFECPAGYTCTRPDRVPVRCRRPSVVKNNKCVSNEQVTCNRNQYIENGACAPCPLRHRCDGEKAIKCPDTNSVENNQCVPCYTPKYVYGNDCLPCPDNHVCSMSDASPIKCKSPKIVRANTCVSNCAQNQYRINTFCKNCPDGYRCDGENRKPCLSNQYSQNNQCITCTPPKVVSNNVCEEENFGGVCPSTQYRADNGICTACPPRHRCNGVQKIQCLDTEISVNNRCKTCAPPQFVQGNVCVGATSCRATQYRSNGRCMPCPERHRCDGTNKYVCSTLQYVDNNQCKFCNQPKYLDGNDCKVCPTGYTCPSPNVKPIQCVGARFVQFNLCKPCRPGQISRNNACEYCGVNEIAKDNQCTRCPANHIVMNNQCVIPNKPVPPPNGGSTEFICPGDTVYLRFYNINFFTKPSNIGIVNPRHLEDIVVYDSKGRVINALNVEYSSDPTGHAGNQHDHGHWHEIFQMSNTRDKKTRSKGSEADIDTDTHLHAGTGFHSHTHTDIHTHTTATITTITTSTTTQNLPSGVTKLDRKRNKQGRSSHDLEREQQIAQFDQCFFLKNWDKDYGYCATRGTPWIQFTFSNVDGIGKIVVYDRERRIRASNIRLSSKKQDTDDDACFVERFQDKAEHVFEFKTGTKPVNPSTSTDICPKCAPMKSCTSTSCPMSCCAKGGAWFKKCGKPGTDCEHTWQEGIDACANVNGVQPSNSGQGNPGNAGRPVVPVVTEQAGVLCPKCGANKKTGKLNCCATGGAWVNKCGNPGDKRFQYTWADGVRACNGGSAGPIASGGGSSSSGSSGSSSGIGNTVADLAATTSELSSLSSALQAGDLVDVLRQNGPYTVFAPNNAAFEKLTPGTLQNLLQPRSQNTLTTLLSYHVVPGSVVYSRDLQAANTFTTYNGQTLQVQKHWNGVFVSTSSSFSSPAQVVTADNIASNGVVHIIDSILMPQSAPTGSTIVDLVDSLGLSTLTAAITAAGLSDTLRDVGARYTVFAPTNAAFQKLPSGLLSQLLQPVNKPQLVSILQDHIVLGAEYTQNLMTSSQKTLRRTLGSAILQDHIVLGAEKTQNLMTSSQKTLRTLGNEYVTAVIFETMDNRQASGKRMEVMLTLANTAGPRAQIISPDNQASNGVVHSIDTIFIFPQTQSQPVSNGGNPIGGNTIVNLASSMNGLSTFVSALYSADLVEALSKNGPFTVFAPQNQAFGKLSSSVLQNLMDPKSKNQLASILMYHVLSGAEVASKDLLATNSLKTLEGSKLEVQKNWNGVFLSISPSSQPSAQVVNADNQASNGIIHVIDTVLQPPNMRMGGGGGSAINGNPPSQAPNAICTCGTWTDNNRQSCCAAGGSWFGQCGKKSSGYAHTWGDGVRACVTSMRQRRNFTMKVKSVGQDTDSAAIAIKPTANIATGVNGVPQLITTICFAVTVIYVQM